PTRHTVDHVETVSPVDLAVVNCEGDRLCVLPIDGVANDFAPQLLDDGVGKLRTPGLRPRGVTSAAEDQLLFAADGTAGRAIIDLANPGGAIDLTGPEGTPDGIDDRVLASVSLNGASALRAAYFVDAQHRPIVAIAAGEQGVYLVQVGPPQFNIKITQVV